MNKLSFGYKFNPLDQYMYISSLKQDIVPLGLLDQIKYIAHIQLLFLGSLIILMNFP